MHRTIPLSVIAFLLLTVTGAAPEQKPRTPELIAALEREDVAAAKSLLERGAAVNDRGQYGDAPLLIAARRGHTEIVKLLLERRADPEATNQEGLTALHYAARDGNRAMASLLLAAGASAQASGGSDGKMALMFAAESGSLPLVQDLLATGVNVSARDVAGRTALMAARGDEAAVIIRALVARGADVNARDKQGCTALMRAARRGSVPAVHALLESGADPGARDVAGRTALMRAHALGSADVASALIAGGAKGSTDTDRGRAVYVRASLQASLALLQASAATFQEKVGGTCFSCHHQSLPAFAVAAARDRGIAVDADGARKQHEFVLGLFRQKRGAALQALQDQPAGKTAFQPFGGGATTIAYGLLGLASWERTPEPAAETLALYLTRMQRNDGRWRPQCQVRAPSENSDFTPTALAMRALREFVSEERAPEVTAALARGREWLAKTPPANTEEKTFRLLGLAWAGLPREDRHVQDAVKALLADQREDGGWGQTPELKSDAYAAGQVLVALHEGGGLPVTGSVYQRGVDFLLRTQDEDGSWYVKSRARPFQGYIETGFPYGMDQFISCTATSWAAAALALTFAKAQVERPSAGAPRSPRSRSTASSHTASSSDRAGGGGGSR